MESKVIALEAAKSNTEALLAKEKATVLTLSAEKDDMASQLAEALAQLAEQSNAHDADQSSTSSSDSRLSGATQQEEEPNGMGANEHDKDMVRIQPTQILKYFDSDGKYHLGTVEYKTIEAGTGRTLYCINYDDLDNEDLSEGEFQKAQIVDVLDS